MTALARVAALRFETKVVPAVSQMFAALAPLAAPEDRAGYASLRGALALDPDFRTRFLQDNGRAALVRNTAAITTLSGGERINVLPAEARAGIDARLLPGESCEDFAAKLRSAIADPSVSLEIELSFAADVSPDETPLMEAIRRVAAKSRPAGVVVPRVITGFTDAHWFRARGIVSYGFVPRRLRPAETRGVHGANERISIENLGLGVEATLDILRELDRVESLGRRTDEGVAASGCERRGVSRSCLQLVDGLADDVEERLDLLHLEAGERDAQVVLRGRDQAGLVAVEQVHAQRLRLHALQPQAHEVAAVEGIHVPVVAEARRVHHLVHALGAHAQDLALLLALGVHRRRRERALDERLRELRAVRDRAADGALHLRLERRARAPRRRPRGPGRT